MTKNNIVLRRITIEEFLKNPTQYDLVSGHKEGAPLCPYGNHFKWIGYDATNKEFVRFSKRLFKKIIQEKSDN